MRLTEIKLCFWTILSKLGHCASLWLLAVKLFQAIKQELLESQVEKSINTSNLLCNWHWLSFTSHNLEPPIFAVQICFRKVKSVVWGWKSFFLQQILMTSNDFKSLSYKYLRVVDFGLSWTRNMGVFSETTYSSQTKLIGEGVLIGEHRIGYSNLTPDPQGA